MNTQEEIHENCDLFTWFNDQLNSPRYYKEDWNKREYYRVNKNLAKRWLLENKSIILNGKVYYLEIKNIGLGLCGVDIAPLDKRLTEMVNEFTWKF